MEFIDYYDARDRDLRNWTAVPIEIPLLLSMINDQVNWLTVQASTKKFFLQPMAGTFWFEDANDALLYRLQWA